jgi:hypothetical protein
MRNVLSIIALVAAGFSITQAAAAPLGNPGALTGAIEDTAITEQVHCVPGWYHHSGGASDGCYGGYYGGGYRGYRGGAYRGYRGGAAYRGGAYRGGVYRGGARGGGRGGGRRSDMRLKHDIMLLGYLENGLPFYRFAYTGSNAAYVGVMAQDVQKVDPHAVTMGPDGYMRVYYERLGLKFQTYDQWMTGGGTVPSGGTR